MKTLKILGLCACAAALMLTVCGKNKVTNPPGPSGSVFDWSDTLALRTILNANGLTAISAGNQTYFTIILDKNNFHRIREITLINKNMTVIPAAVKELTALYILRLDSNAITALPPEIGKCTTLTLIQMPYNQLTTLPSEIGSLHSLQTLILSHNNISSLPPSLWTMTSLGVLRLGYNSLAGLSSQVSNLTNLTALSLNTNVLDSLPVSLMSLNSLQMLEIANNHICPGALTPTFVGWLDMRAEANWETMQGTCP